MQQFKVLLFSLIAVPLSALGSVNHSVSSAKKNHEYYVRANLGLPFYRKAKKGFQDSIRFMPHGNVAVGMRYKKFGADIEGGYLYFKTRSMLDYNIPSRSSLNSKTLLLNLFFYPILLKNKIRPYLGAGLGCAFNDSGNRYSNVADTWLLTATSLKVRDVAIQGIIGWEYILNSKFSMLTDIRYLYLGKFQQKHSNVNAKSVEKLSIATLMIGAKCKF
jgi:opacity protein-like surface antigen